MYTIVAPHPDDELIGCYSLLIAGLVSDVIVCADKNLDTLRWKETKALCDHFKIDFWIEANPQELVTRLDTRQFLVPSLTDNHPYHKYINRLFYDVKKGIYSVDMQAEFVKELNNADKKYKKELLDQFYPSQKELWEKDAKYYLFEGITFEIF